MVKSLYLEQKILAMFIILIVFGALILIALAGYLFPKNVHIERSKTINAKSDVVFEHISNLEHFKNWNPWAEKDPDIQVTIKGTAKGSSYNWKGNSKVREGSLTILDIVPNKQVDFELDFGFKNKSYTSLIMDEIDGKIKVTWSMDSNMGNNPTSRYMGLFMDKFVGKDYEQGLENLRKACEKQ